MCDVATDRSPRDYKKKIFESLDGDIVAKDDGSEAGGNG